MIVGAGEKERIAMFRIVTLVSGAVALALCPALAVAAAEAEAPPIERKIPDGPPSAMTNAQIAEHNVGLEPAHPDFIKCRKIDVIGSLAKKARVCRTNEGWTESWRQGNQNARDNADHFAPKFQDCRNGGGC
jgi:hypothetical protein